MGDLHYQYIKSRLIVTSFKGGLPNPHIKIKKSALVARYTLTGISMMLVMSFEGFNHFNALISAVSPEATFLTIGENIGNTIV